MIDFLLICILFHRLKIFIKVPIVHHPGSCIFKPLMNFCECYTLEFNRISIPTHYAQRNVATLNRNSAFSSFRAPFKNEPPLECHNSRKTRIFTCTRGHMRRQTRTSTWKSGSIELSEFCRSFGVQTREVSLYGVYRPDTSFN